MENRVWRLHCIFIICFVQFVLIVLRYFDYCALCNEVLSDVDLWPHYVGKEVKEAIKINFSLCVI